MTPVTQKCKGPCGPPYPDPRREVAVAPHGPADPIEIWRQAQLEHGDSPNSKADFFMRIVENELRAGSTILAREQNNKRLFCADLIKVTEIMSQRRPEVTIIPNPKYL